MEATLRKAVAINLRTDDFDVIRGKTAIHLLLETGIRVGELVAIDLSDLSLTNGCLVINGKGNRQRLVCLLQKPLHRKIEQYLTWRSSVPTCTEKLFVNSNGKAILAPNVRVALRDIAKEAGVSKHVTPHMLRHPEPSRFLSCDLHPVPDQW